MLRIATGIFCMICCTIAVLIVMDAGKISYARMVDQRSREVQMDRVGYTAEQNTKLSAYTWVDKEEGGVSIPVDRAMQVMVTELGGGQWAPILPKPFSLEDKGITNEGLLAFASRASNVEKGSALYSANCAGCHGANGSGLSGPNLTDGYWLHGSEPTDLYTTVYVGIGAKGMPAWGGAFGAQVKDVIAYVMSLKDTNIAGKAPQGVDAEGNEAPQ
ncbi:MAG: c-type cytochrome [Deltaproteobacteria bacterium]|nr:c-type cytochrome [Deltaproteobacteria bacterium]MBT6431808.1 c-type cytochrome [Deltaproteobacteria bacterium]